MDKRITTPVIITALLIGVNSVSAAIVGDINQDGKIDITEAVYALQVSSGVYPSLDSSCLLSGNGTWDIGADYIECDVVEHGGLNYVCTNSHTPIAGTNEPPNASFWTLLTLEGPPGPPGATVAGQNCTGNSSVTGFDDTGNIICSNKLVFVTSTLHDGNLGGVSGADVKCNDSAIAAGLDGTFKAWISVGEECPANTFQNRYSAYKLVDGTIIAINWVDLTDGDIQNFIDKDEHGVTVTTNRTVWTNTQADGTTYTINTDSTCGDFTSNTSENSALNGYAFNTDYKWTFGAHYLCNTVTKRLYCFEQ